jgi:hypothetical protein
MPAHPIDRLSLALAKGATRRSVLASIGAAIGIGATARIDAGAQNNPVYCDNDAHCVDHGLVCTSVGVCGYPECVDYGESCSGDGDCCSDFICTSGVCSVSPTCVLLGAGCSSDDECCPGTVCLAGACGYPPPPPPENTGGGNTGGEGGDGGNTGGEGTTSGGSTTGTTTSGVFVSGLPSTGITGDSSRREKWGLAAAAMAGGAGLLGLSRRSTSPSIDPNAELQDQD